jgi:predicted PhzF superfamily epimerase YddE/YHI9
MNLSETAYAWPLDKSNPQGDFSLRWFTPSLEVDLCGHATLATAFALWETGFVKMERPVRFMTRSGSLDCSRIGDWIEMDFPSMPAVPSLAPTGLKQALGCELLQCEFNGMDYLVEVHSETVLRELTPDFTGLAKLPSRGVIVTASTQGGEFDFVSRFFAPGAGIDEDPVTGSAHCALGPYWAPKLQKTEFTAFQASARGGIVKLTVEKERVRLRGQAVLMSHVNLLHWP